MSTILKLVQGSPEWLDYRRTMWNASETRAVLGISPWVTPYGLWLVKTGRSTQATNEAMVHGTTLEPEARAAYEEQTGQIMNPLVLQDGSFSASLDGITLTGDLIVEIKCPFRGQASPLWKQAKERLVPDHYNTQIQPFLPRCHAARMPTASPSPGYSVVRPPHLAASRSRALPIPAP
jgi:putative phage-type endonuclease